MGCAVWEYENMRSHAVSMIKRPMKFFRKQADYSLDKYVSINLSFNIL